MGVGVGILLGLTGIGSGSVLTPLLILFGGLPPATAVGTSLVFASATKVAGSWRFYRRGLVHLPIIRRLLVGALPGLLLGTALVLRLRGSSPRLENVFLLRAIGVALVCVFLLMTARLLPLRAGQNLVERVMRFGRRHDRILVFFTGFAVGLAVTLTSIGAGAALIPVLYLVYRLDAGTLVGTSIFLGTVLSAAGALLHAGTGDVDLRVTGVLLLGSLPAIWLASHVHGRLPREVSEAIIAAALLALGIRFFFL